jgi:hypothetical protein
MLSPFVISQRKQKTSFVVIVIVAVAVLAATVCAYEYNAVDVKFVDSRENFRNTYFSSENGNANVNIYVGVFLPHCLSTLLECHPFFAAQRVGATAVKAVTIAAEEFPLSLNNECAEVFYYRIGDPYLQPKSRITDVSDPNAVLQWMRDAAVQEITVENVLSVDIHFGIFGDQASGVIPARTAQTLYSTTGVQLGFHTNLVDQRSIIGFATISGPSVRVDRYLAYSNCNIPPSEAAMYDSAVADDLEAINALKVNCNLFGKWVDMYTQQSRLVRITSNYLQPKLLPRTSRSSLGFQLVPLPASIYEQLLTWYHEKLSNQVIEAYGGDVINQLNVSTYMASLSELESYQFGYDLHPIMQDWYAGSDLLKFSNSYGFRYYGISVLFCAASV